MQCPTLKKPTFQDWVAHNSLSSQLLDSGRDVSDAKAVSLTTLNILVQSGQYCSRLYKGLREIPPCIVWRGHVYHCTVISHDSNLHKTTQTLQISLSCNSYTLPKVACWSHRFIISSKLPPWGTEATYYMYVHATCCAQTEELNPQASWRQIKLIQFLEFMLHQFELITQLRAAELLNPNAGDPRVRW